MNDNQLHTFSICAYKESEHLEACIQSLMNQTMKTNILISTSTPNQYITDMAAKYHIPVYETGNPSDIQDDWNSAFSRATTPLVTVAHQDDIYDKFYAESVVQAYQKDHHSSLIFTDYLPIKNGVVGERDFNSKMKRFFRTVLKVRSFSDKRFFKVMSLAFGNSISCPSVTYNRAYSGDRPFTSELKFGLDWDTFLKFARQKGRFNYLDRPLIYYRVYDGATTKKFIVDNTRQREDIYMFDQIWPHFITKIFMKVYVKAYDTYE